jgi:pimeloyl-ACP methyl ester carboxylesterase
VTPSSITEMARDTASFLEVRDVSRVDVFGYSIGGS